MEPRHILITGASSGIGQACASLLQNGNRLSLGARRADRLPDPGPNGYRGELDVTDEASIESFLSAAEAAAGPIDVLINNAGLARGLEKVAEADGIAWREMIETNVLGVLNISRRVLPQMLSRGCGDVVMIGSIAGHEAYEGGSVYCASKHALQSITRAMRYEVLGSGVRVMSVDPGMVETEFSIVRFRGDEAAADKVYEGTRPLTAVDVADCVQFAINRPAHVTLDCIQVMPTDQASAKRVHRSNPLG
ncbi:MAG: SDR family NAD(P)-dependent oxidoreductase [Planctomycetota bacterium]|jgi:NADP-dependent 3-hydroxy acid dehydrogenase YdfG